MLEFLKSLFIPAQLFYLRPLPVSQKVLIILAVIFALFIITAIATKFIKSKDVLKDKGVKKFFNLFLTMGILGYVYLFFIWQAVPLLAARFWFLLWLIVTAVWLGFVLKYLILEVPKKRNEINKRREFEKYIP